ncbi:MAG: Gfo/Idh/MocA family oxidoreductase [Planctomycetes bacterium]|nr:Gfo/Idh/MocA family oxidoreductase [Planctomycetota bacterium]
MPATAPVRLVIIGCGSIAKGGYQPRCLAYPHLISLHGYFDQNRAAAEELRQIAGSGRVYASVDEVLADPEVEAVLNLTTLGGHYPVTLAALKAGKHAFSEKPISITSAEADELIREAAQRKLKLGCAPSSSLGYEQQSVWVRIRAGEIGTPHTVLGSFACSRLECWHANADVFMTTGVSVAADATPYPLCVMTTYFGPIARVFGFARNTVPERTLQTGPRKGTVFKPTIPDHVLGALEFANGMKGMLYAGWSGQSEFPRLEIQGSEGAFSVHPHNDGMGIRLLSAKDHEIHTVPSPAKAFPKALDWGKGVADFADAIRRDRRVRCSAEQARHLVEIAERLNESSRTGMPVAVTSRFEAMEPIGDVAPWEHSGGQAQAVGR